MNAEIISVGTELLLGKVVNTDTTILARALSGIGINLLYAATVGDNPTRLRSAVQEALARSDLLITTGGLGPTADDLTKETVAQAAGKPLVCHEESRKRLLAQFPDGMSENLLKQVYLPQGCEVLLNDNGTAPGCVFYTDKGKLVMMFPGPPSELEPMLMNYALPYLSAQGGQGVIASHNIHVYGRGEAPIAMELADMMDGVNPTVAPYAKEGEMFLRVTAKAESQKAADALCAPVIAEIRQRVGDFVYSVDVESLEELVVQSLAQKGMRLATAESCTGGLLAKRLTDVMGASAVFATGLVTYANESKMALLGVPEALLQEHGAVSEQCAIAMAEGVQKRSNCHLGIGITGIAGPGGGTAEKPVGLVYIALSDGKQSWVTARKPFGRKKNREWHRFVAASQALDMVRRYLEGLDICGVTGK